MKILIALPVYNEEIVLAKNVKTVLEFCQQNFSQDQLQIIIADNKSTDSTAVIAKQLIGQMPAVGYLYLPTKGKGLAWRQAFLANQADYYVVMDVDLAVDLSALKTMIADLKQGYDLVIGSRYLADSLVRRSLYRDLASKVYRYFVRWILASKISDFQCGFKGLNNSTKEKILSQTIDEGFFLDTELSTLAEKAGLKIKEIPVDWEEARDLKRKSTVNVFETTVDYLSKVWQLRRRLKKQPRL